MTHPPSQTGALPSRALASSATISGLVFATLAVLELLLQASGRDLISLPVWGTLLLGHGLLAASVAVGGVVLAGGLDVARRLGLPLPANISAADGTAALATLVVGFIHGWPLVKEAWSPWLGRPLALVLLALGLLGVCLLLRGVASAGELAVPLACAAAALLGFYLLRAEPLGLKPAPLVVALGILVATLVALGWITTRGGRLRSVQLLAVALGLVLVVRLAAPAPHGWIEQAVGDPAPRSARGAAASTPVFLVVLDTLRADAVDLDAASQSGAQSSTPSLARLASHSDVFHRAIANGSWTLPTHASMFTGLQVSEHRLDMTSARGFGPRLAADIPTLHEHLAARGYATSCITANGVVSPATGLTRGCQRYRNPNRVWMLQTAPLRLWYALSPSPRPALEEQLTTQLLGLRRTASAGEVIRLALQELERQELDAAESLSESGAPYLFLNFMDVHKPYSPSASSDPAQRRAFFGDLLRVLAGRTDADAFDRDHAELLHQAYGEQVTRLDAELGRFFDDLRARGLYDDALIVVTSDHGEAFHDNPELPLYYDHHGAYEAAVRIPLIIKRPRQQQARHFHHPVGQAELAPGLLGLLGAATPADPIAPGGLYDDERQAPLITEWNPHPIPGALSTLPMPRVGLYQDQLKLVVEGDWHRGLGQGSDRADAGDGTLSTFLYDLDAAPFESAEVGDRLPEQLAALQAELRAWHAQTWPNDPTAEPEAPDPELLETLRALGYVP